MACSIPEYCLLPNDTVGSKDMSLVMLAAPTCNANLTELLSMFSSISFHVSSADIGGSLLSQLLDFIESSFCV